jgi:hypothetical protein
VGAGNIIVFQISYSKRPSIMNVVALGIQISLRYQESGVGINAQSH